MDNNLKKYNSKRDFTKTKEPSGKKVKSKKKLRYVIQHHLASRDHYDLRLEWYGTMKSWAIPKGPSYSSKDKRLAVMVEDHPIDYRNFEGTIPKGQYGGGTVMIWDEGFWEPLEKQTKEFNESLKFVINGQKLKGKWTLVHMKEENWLFIKENDEYNNDQINLKDYDFSVKTGKTMNEIN